MHLCLWRRALTLSALATTSLAIWPFPEKKFSGNSMLNAGSLGITEGERVIAFGDFNGDQFLDLLMLDADQQTFRVYLWDHAKFQYLQSASFSHSGKVYNVVPGDFTYSGKLDLLVMGHDQSKGPLDLQLYEGLATGGFDTSHPIAIPSSSLSQPIPVDLDGDMKIDLLGYRDNTLKSWKNVWNASNPQSSLFALADSPLPSAKCTIANPHSNAVVDFDGDCLADVFLVCDNGRGSKSYQIWINHKDAGFSLAQQGSFPSGLQSISFADVDRDGTMDIVFTTCSTVGASTGLGKDCSINVAFNQQLRLCSSSTDSETKKGERVCRQPDNLCTADPSFKFDMDERADNQGFMRIPISALFPRSEAQLLVQDVSFTPKLPVSLKLGDANLDGFPDILLIVNTAQRALTPKLLISVPCDKGVIGCKSDGSGRRGWQVSTEGVKSLEAIRDARSVSFLDMDEDGTLDIMVQRSGSDGSGKITFVQNNFYYDAFFLKATVLNGACGNGWCVNENGTNRYHPFGVSYSGATYKYTILDTTGTRAAAQVGQLPQTSYHSLQTPYSFFGLGRTNNYIENLFVGSTMHTKDHFINLEGVIPNSKVVILPSRTEAWKRELFLRPGNWIPWVTLTVIIGMFILSLTVLMFHLNEKREDELDRRKASHHINFDAL